MQCRVTETLGSFRVSRGEGFWQSAIFVLSRGNGDCLPAQSPGPKQNGTFLRNIATRSLVACSHPLKINRTENTRQAQ